jgi:hypothetical protein
MRRAEYIIHGIFIILFVVFVAVGVSIFRDYGVQFDEYNQIALGQVNEDRIVSGSMKLTVSEDRYYGPAFETLLTTSTPALESIFHGDIIASRHIGLFIFFSLSVVVFYLLLWEVFGHPAYGLLGTLALVLSPRIFAESFYNTKDIAFLSAGIFVLYGMQRSIVLSALLSGFANAIRPQGAVFVVINIIAVMFGSKRSKKQKVYQSMCYITLTILSTILFFPIFWSGGMATIIGFFHRSLDPVGVPTWYFGKYYISPNIPWHYLLVEIGITNLVSIVVLTVVGIIFSAWKRPKQNMVLSMWLIVIGSIFSAIMVHARVYDGWRHLYYIYPSMIGLSIYVLQQAYIRRRILFYLFLALVVVDSMSALRFMIRNHPYEYVYFNILAGGSKNAQKQFDFDYWGMSYKQVYEYLQTIPPSRIYIDEPFPYVEHYMMPMLRMKGFTFVDQSGSADISIFVHRYKKTLPDKALIKVFAPSVGGADLVGVYATKIYVEKNIHSNR